MKFLSVFILLLLVIQLKSQSVILFEQDSISEKFENVEIDDITDQFSLDLFYKNNTDNDISIHWRREFSDNCPMDWNVISSDNLLSYIWSVNQSEMAIDLTPSDSNFILRQTFIPLGTPGCCDITMIISLEDEPENPIDTGYYHVEINAEGCITTSINNESIESLKIYPNPNFGTLKIDSKESITFIQLLDLTGKVVLQKENLHDQSLNISFLDKGIYLCRIKTKSGEFITRKIIKL